MAYVFLLAAIAAEVVGTSLLKSTEGFTRLWPTIGCLVAYAVAFTLLSQAVKVVPVGIAYAIWSGVGTAAIVAIGVFVLHQPMTLVKVIGVTLIVGGVILLNAGGSHH